MEKGSLPPKKSLKDLVSLLKRHAATWAASAAAIYGSLTELVILLPLLRVVQHLISLRDLFEVFLSRGLVVGIFIGVVLQREFLVRLGDLIVRSAALHPEDAVEVVGLNIW